MVKTPDIEPSSPLIRILYLISSEGVFDHGSVVVFRAPKPRKASVHSLGHDPQQLQPAGGRALPRGRDGEPLPRESKMA